MSEMVERVARAIEAKVNEGRDFCSAEDVARAAIEAMREPTEAMEEAALDVRPLMLPDSPREVWGAMIDAALNKEGKG